MSIIKDLFLFNGLEEFEKNSIIAKLPKAITFKKDEKIYSTQSFKNALGIIVCGRAVAHTSNNDNLVIKKFTDGMCFGAAAVFGSGENYVSEIICETNVEIIFITEDFLCELFKEFPKTAINYISFLSDKVRFLNEKLSVISCPDAENTLLNYLISVSDNNNTAQIPKNMTLFAKMLGLSRATLYRCLDNLENNGQIIREKYSIKVIENEKID